MTTPKHALMALDIPLPARDALDPDVTAMAAAMEQEAGFVPNVLTAYTFDQDKLRGFFGFYMSLTHGKTGISPLEHEMIAVAVSSINHCVYCLTSHGHAIRKLSGDPVLGELLVMNYREAPLSPRQRAMLDFAVKMTEQPDRIGEPDRQALRDAGFSEVDIFDIAAIAGFYNMTNRLAGAVGMVPNEIYHRLDR